MAEQLSSGDIAKTGNCKVQTVRCDEETGLLPKAARSAGNQRVFSRAGHDRLRFIRQAREPGFSLERIGAILALGDEPGRSCAEVGRIAREHLRDVEARIERRRSPRAELERMISACGANRVRIVEVLSNHDICLHDARG